MIKVLSLFDGIGAARKERRDTKDINLNMFR